MTKDAQRLDAAVFLTTGFEEIEALATVDVLRRAGLAVRTVSLEDATTVVGSHSVPVVADALFDAAALAHARMLVVPGGTTRYAEHAGLAALLRQYAANPDQRIAAICASPAVLGGLGLLDGRAATCYPGFEDKLGQAVRRTDEAVVVDGAITTGRGPGLTLAFALELVEQLAGAAKREEVARGLLLA